MSNLAWLFRDMGRLYSRRVAIVSSAGESMTYSQLLEESARLADQLKKRGIIRGNNVGLYLPNSPKFVKAYIAVQLCGAVPVLISAHSREWDLKRVLSLCKLSGLICDKIGNLDQSTVMANRIDHFYSEFDELNCIFFRQSTNNPLTDSKVAVIIPTSGSMSAYKAVMLSHENIISNARMCINHLKLGKDESCLVVLPLTSAFAHTTQMIAHLSIGSKLLFSDRIFFPRTFLKTLKESNPSITGLVPSMLAAALSEIDSPLETQLKKIILAGAPISNALLHLSASKLKNVDIVKAYGLTEAGPRVTQLHPKDFPNKSESVGKPLPGIKIKICDEKARELIPGSTGEIFVKGPNVMLGYFGNAALTSAVVRDGWLKTGDLGSVDQDGYLSVKGRKKNIIIKNGLKIYPEEIEDFLCSLSGIKEAFVFQRKDKNGSEIIKAKVVSESGTPLTHASIIKICRRNIAPYKIPDEFQFVKEINKSLNGKIKRKRRVLAEEAIH